MREYYKLGEKTTVRKTTGDNDNIVFDGWALHKTDKGLFVSYIVASHGGGEKEFQIDEENFNKARNGEIGLTELKNLFDP